MTKKKVARLKADLVKISEHEAIEILRYKLAEEGVLVVGQVANGTGARKRRTADGLMIQTWPSRGLSITGVEYKANRNDWRRELRNGSKAEEVAAYCHFWTLLAPKGVIPIEEVPAGWGLLEIHKTEKQTRLLRTKPAPPQDEVKDLDLSFLAAIMRARESYRPEDARLEQELERRDQVRRNTFQQRVDERTREHKRLLEKVLVFEEASGIDIRHGWSLDSLGKALATFLKDPDQFRERLKRDRVGLVRMLEITDEILGDQ